MRQAVRHCFAGLALAAALAPASATAQILIEASERLADDRPEAWAANRATAASLMTGFGDTTPAPGTWRVAAELAQVPHFDAAQRRVGFNGNKVEDLNKAPVFGRLRVIHGLPHGFAVELGWTPPVRHRGARAEDLVAVALSKRWALGGAVALTARAFGQHGDIAGDITCPARLAGIDDFAVNPYGCQAPSRDRVSLHHHGLELGIAAGTGAWRWHAGVGALRNEAQVQVDALVYDARDRTRLVVRDTRPFFAAGVRRHLGGHWSVAAEVLHMPMSRRIGPGHPHAHEPGEEHADDRPVDGDPYTGLRVQLAWDAGGTSGRAR